MNLLRDDLERPTTRNHALSTTVQVLVALCFFASESFLQVIGDTLGLSKSTIPHTVNVSYALSQKQVHLIEWPSTEAEIVQTKQGFYDKGGFPGVIGCVDGMHVKIQGPTENENDYVNRKGFHSTRASDLQSQRYVKIAFNKFRVKLKTMGVVVNGSSSRGPRGLPPYFGYKRNYKRMKNHQGRQNTPPPIPLSSRSGFVPVNKPKNKET